MLNVFDYIENYCKVHGIKAKSFKSCVLTKDKMSERQTFAPGIAFFYRTRVTGFINDIADLDKDFMIVKTPTDIWDFSKIGVVLDDGAVQRVESDFIFIADNTMQIDLKEGMNCLFSAINTVQMFYIYVSILPDVADVSNARGYQDNARVYDIQVNRSLTH